MGDPVDLRSGLATSVGPVPFDDADEAIDFVLETQPELPTAPTPGTGPRSLLAQAVDGIDGVSVTRAGQLRVDTRRFDGRARGAARGRVDLGPAHDPLRRFLRRVRPHAAATPGFVGVRLAVTGPVSLTLALRAAGVDLDVAAELAGRTVANRARAVLRAARGALAEHLVVVCLNEPGLVGAAHPTFPLAPSQVLDLLDPTIDALDGYPLAAPLLIGAHVPGHTDWDTVIASGVSVISTPAVPGLAGWAESLGGFLDRGGRIVWGAVPVDQPLGTSEELLWRRLSGVWCELVGEGLDPLDLRTRSLVSPVDGLGHFGATQAGLAMELVGSISTRVGRQAVAARLSLGA